MKNFKRPRIAGLLVLSLLLLAIVAGKTSADGIWTIEYDGSVLPQHADPPWLTTGLGFVTTDGDILTIDTIGTGCEQKAYHISDIVDQAAGINVEARIRIGSIGSEGLVPDTAILIVDSERAFKLVLLEDRIAAIGEGQDNSSWEDLDNYHLMDTTSDFHVYRLTLQSGVVSVYVDGIHRLTTMGTPWPSNYVAFGEVRASCGGMNGLSHWDYVKIGVPLPIDALQQQVQSARNRISGFSPNSFDAPNPKAVENRRQALLNMLDEVYEYIAEEDFQAAVDQLKDILAKSDALSPPDSAPDWIIDDPLTGEIDEQQEIAQAISDLIGDLEAFL